jgi:hypothetical protein
MNPRSFLVQAHPAPEKEVVAMDEAEVNVCGMSINRTSDLIERMGKNE